MELKKAEESSTGIILALLVAFPVIVGILLPFMPYQA